MFIEIIRENPCSHISNILYAIWAIIFQVVNDIKSKFIYLYFITKKRRNR